MGAMIRSICSSVDALGPEPLVALLRGAAGAHGAEVADVGRQGGHQRGDVELGVVGEHADRVAGAEVGPDLVQQAVGPVHDDLVGQREPGLGGEDLPGVADRDPVAEHLGHPHEGGGEVHGTEDQHAGRRRVGLHEDHHGVLAGLAVLAVAPHRRDARGHGRLGVALHHPGQVGVGDARADRAARNDQQLGPGAGPVHHGGQRGGALLGHGPAQLVVEGGVGHRYQSRGSRKRWTVPPQVRPTAKASSSL
jgi:hypothetical protein